MFTSKNRHLKETMQPCYLDSENSSTSNYFESNPQQEQKLAEQSKPFVETAVAVASGSGTSKRKKKVKRNAIPAPSSKGESLDVAVHTQSIAHNRASGTASKLSLESFGVSEKSIGQLRSIWKSTPIATHFGVFESLIFHLFTSMATLQKHLDENLKIETFSSSLKGLASDFHFNLYEVLIEVHLKLVYNEDQVQRLSQEKTIFSDIPLVMAGLIKKVETFDQAFSQPSTKQALLQRVSAIRQKERLAGNILTPIRALLDEVKLTLAVLSDFIAMPCASIQALSLPVSSQFLEFSGKAEQPLEVCQATLKEYAHCMATLIEQARERGFTSVLTLDKTLYRILLQDVAGLASLSLKEEYIAFSSLKEADDALCELLKLQDKTRVYYSKSLSGLLTHRQFLEQNHSAVVREKNQDEFSAMLLNGFLCWNVMIDSYASIYNCSASLIEKNNVLLIDEEVLAKIAFCWHHVSSAREERDHKVLDFVLRLNIEKIRANIHQPSLITLIDEYFADVLAIHEQFRTIMNKQVLSLLEKFLDPKHFTNWQSLYKIREILEPLKGAMKDFQAKSLLFNKRLTSEYGILKFKEAITYQEASFLTEQLKQLKCDISSLLSNPFDLMELFLKATSWNVPQKRHGRKPQKHLELRLDTAEIHWIFDIKLKLPQENTQPAPSVIDTETTEPSSYPTEVKEPSLPPKINKPASAASTSLQPAPKTSGTRAESDDGQLDSVKLKVLMKFLTDKGWKVYSIKGSHLKLKLRGEALIVPVNNPELKRGTMHGILKQEQEKERRLIEKK